MKSSSRPFSPIASSPMSCPFQASRPTGESASACASVCGCWECSWLNENLWSMNHCSLARAAISCLDRPSNSAGSPDGKEKTWVTCTAVTWSGSSRPTSGESERHDAHRHPVEDHHDEILSGPRRLCSLHRDSSHV